MSALPGVPGFYLELRMMVQNRTKEPRVIVGREIVAVIKDSKEDVFDEGEKPGERHLSCATIAGLAFVFFVVLQSSNADILYEFSALSVGQYPAHARISNFMGKDVSDYTKTETDGSHITVDCGGRCASSCSPEGSTRCCNLRISAATRGARRLRTPIPTWWPHDRQRLQSMGDHRPFSSAVRTAFSHEQHTILSVTLTRKREQDPSTGVPAGFRLLVRGLRDERRVRAYCQPPWRGESEDGRDG